MKSLTILGDYGELHVNPITGVIWNRVRYMDVGMVLSTEYDDVALVDMQEYGQWLDAQHVQWFPDTLDIVFVGLRCTDGTYDAPVLVLRQREFDRCRHLYETR